MTTAIPGGYHPGVEQVVPDPELVQEAGVVVIERTGELELNDRIKPKAGGGVDVHHIPH